MKFGIYNWRSSIFTRFIIVFLLIMTPVYILGLSIYNWGLGMVEDEISLSMATQVDFFLNNLESEVKRIKSLQYECLYDENLLFLANASQTLSNFEKTQSLLRLQHRLGVMKNSSIYIKDVYAYIPSIKRTVSAMTGVNEDFGEVVVAEATPDESDAQIIYWKDNDGKDRLFLCNQYPLSSIFSQRSPRFILLTELSKDGFINGLLTFNNREESGSMIINRRKAFYLSYGLQEGMAERILKISPSQKNGVKDIINTIKMKDKSYLAVIRKSDYLNLELAVYTPEEQVYERIRKYQDLFIIFTVVSAIIMILFSFSTYRLIHKPLLMLVNAFKKLEKGSMDISIEHKHNDEFRYLYHSFNAMVTNLGGLIDQVYKQKIFNQRAELKQLQSQINPHFLYNSFFIICRMARLADCDNIKVFAEHLGSYYQFITRNSTDEVALIKEVEHAKTYTDIQSMRFSNRIQVEFGCLPEEYTEISIPRLVIQPIIENAFEHGLKDKEEDGLIRINFEQITNGIIITVDDNGSGTTDEEVDNLNQILQNETGIFESTGIINVHRRIRLKYGKDSGVVVTRSSIGGIRVEVTITLRKEE